MPPDGTLAAGLLYLSFPTVGAAVVIGLIILTKRTPTRKKDDHG